MKELFEKFVFMGFTKEQASGAYKFSWRGGLFLFVATSLGVASPYISGFARDAAVEQRVETTQSKLIAEIQSVKLIVAQQSAIQNENLADGIASQIRAHAVKRCPPSTPKDREAANSEIEKLQKRYKGFMAERYDIPECGVL